ncbi:MAG: lysyl oxidase family protein [Saprospiraceae bacterium]|nr:lysyl oxidase family protein [Saprospiraceae bacterium]
MKSAHFFLALLFGFISFEASAQCPPGQDSVRVEINHNNFFFEISWEITSLDGSIEYGSGMLQDTATNVYTVCVPADQCVKFTIFGGFSGLFPDGWYRLYVNDTLVYARPNGSFQVQTETVEINCPPGSSCVSPIYLSLGAGTTPTAEETWFSFTPVDTGFYVFATCGAVCPTKIWIYDRCAGIFISEIHLGTIYYSKNGCPDGSASVHLNLEGGKQYYIRVRYQTLGCSTEPVPYTITYLGPIVGCLDPTACNYEPLATISSGICLYPGDPDCPIAPDLVVKQDVLLNTIEFVDMYNADPCLIEAGCMRGLGTRYVIRFATQFNNEGDADYWIGKPPEDINEPSTQFVFDPCHQHWHYMGYADYILYNSEGYRIPIGSKTGFCVLDAFCFGIDQKFNCINMGISAGCGDGYPKETPCQWIDITDIPAGDYTMVVRINWDKSPDKLGRVEKTYDNNWAQACFTLSYDGNTPDVLFNPDSCQQFTDCNGEVFGDALIDCNGVCQGPALIGDWNQDTLRNATDVMGYLNAALADNGVSTPCNDLHEDGEINVFDAALLLECNLYADSQQHWIQRFPCQFPTGFLNTQDLVTIQPGTLDTLAKTFNIQIANPLNEILGYEFSVSGIEIASVENLATEFNAAPMFNAGTGKIIALASDKSSINKNFVPGNFLRVHYSKLTANKVCVSEITAVVNDKFQQSNATLGDPNCVPVNFVSVGEPGTASFAVFVQPNPMGESTTVFFENENAEPMMFTLTDLTGRTLRFFNDLRGESVSIDREGLPQGTYLFTLRGSRGSVSGKIIMR